MILRLRGQTVDGFAEGEGGLGAGLGDGEGCGGVGPGGGVLERSVLAQRDGQRAVERVAGADGVDRLDLRAPALAACSRSWRPGSRAAPRVITTARSAGLQQPVGAQRSSPARESEAGLIRASASASRRLGVRTSTSESKAGVMASGDAGAGAGLRITRIPAREPRSIARAAVSTGISSPASSTSPARKTESGRRSMSSGLSLRLAPEATPIMFSPSSPTKISATPEEIPSQIRT